MRFMPNRRLLCRTSAMIRLTLFNAFCGTTGGQSDLAGIDSGRLKAAVRVKAAYLQEGSCDPL